MCVHQIWLCIDLCRPHFNYMLELFSSSFSWLSLFIYTNNFCFHSTSITSRHSLISSFLRQPKPNQTIGKSVSHSFVSFFFFIQFALLFTFSRFPLHRRTLLLNIDGWWVGGTGDIPLNCVWILNYSSQASRTNWSVYFDKGAKGVEGGAEVKLR